ncbi:MAG: radical SAM protein [Phycisphaerae bacterium]|nr:radical SAM protein [Phycisphaerae bacterium]
MNSESDKFQKSRPAEAVRVLLIYPPSRSQMHESCPAALMMLGAVLEQAGIEVRLMDANAAANRRDSEEIVRLASGFRPQVIGMTLLTPLVRESYRLAGLLRQTGARLLAGGPHATILPEEPLSHGFDAVVVGEGESTILDAVMSLAGRLPRHEVLGWVYRDNDGSIRRTDSRPVVTDLDTLPFPARHLVDPKDYGGTVDGALHANLFTSRGCPARCTYCAGDLFGKRFRFRSADSILREMKEVYGRYGTRHFHFVDDAMTVNKERVRDLCSGLRDSGLKVTWSMMTRIDQVNEDLLRDAAAAGCVRVDYGVESGCPETLKRIHKPHTVEMVRRVIAWTAEAGIRPCVFFILGFPWEGTAEIDATQQLMVDLSPYVDSFHPAIASVLIPFPGTEVYEQYKDRYSFRDWWLGRERNYDAPDLARHSFFERRVFARGAVLDADFFHYPPQVKKRIRQVFRFMYLHNRRRSNRLLRWAHRTMLDVSEWTHMHSPCLERLIFAPVTAAEQAFGRR